MKNGILAIEGVKTTAFEPFYPLFLAAARQVTQNHIFYVLILQILTGAIGCIYLYELGCLLSGSKRTGIIAALLYSFYPYLIYQAGALTEITLLATLLIISSYYYSKAADLKNSVYAGIFFALAVLTRAATLPIVAISAVNLAIQKRFRQSLLVSAATFLLLLPIMIRNYQIDGSLFFTRSGENLYDGNMEFSDRLIPYYSVDVLYPYVSGMLKKERPEISESGTEKEKNDFFTEKAVHFISQHPWEILKLKIKNIFYFFSLRLVPFHPMNQDTKLIWNGQNNFQIINAGHRKLLDELSYAIPYSFILITAMIGIYLRRKLWCADLILYIMIIGFTAVYSLYFPTTRLRAPMDFVLMFYSAFTLDSWLRRKVG